MPVDRETLDELLAAIVKDPIFINAVTEIARRKPPIELKNDSRKICYVRIGHVIAAILEVDLLPLFKQLLGQKPLIGADFYPSGLIKNALGIKTIKFDDALLIAAASVMDFIRPDVTLPDDNFGNYPYPFQRTRQSKGERRKCITLPRLPLYQQLIRDDLAGVFADIEEYRSTGTLKSPCRLAQYESDPDIASYTNFLDYAQQVSKDELQKIRKKLQ
jgi:hypothetical protein